MFDFSWGEIMLIGAVALVVIGPKELPTVLRTAGQWMARIRRMASEFQGQFQEALREAEMTDLKKQVDELNQTARDMSKPIDPKSFATESFATESKPASSAGEPNATPPSAPASETQTSETQTSEPSSASQASHAGTTDVAQTSAHDPSAPEPSAAEQGAHAPVDGDRPA